MAIVKYHNLLAYLYKILIASKEVAVFVHSALMVTILKMKFVSSLTPFAGLTISKAEIVQAATQDM